MNYGDIYSNIALRVWGTPTPEASAATMLKGNDGLISNIRKQIQEQNNLWFMEKTGKIDVLGDHLKKPVYLSVSGTDDTHTACTALEYRIDETDYSVAAQTDIAFSSAYLVQGTATKRAWGAFLFQINAAGTISTKVYDNAQEWESELEAIQYLPTADSGNVAFAYMTIAAEIDNWVANTDNLVDKVHAINFYTIDRTDYALPDRFKEFCPVDKNREIYSVMWQNDNDNFSAPLTQLTTDELVSFTDQDGYSTFPMYYYVYPRLDKHRLVFYPNPDNDATLRFRYFEYLDDIMPPGIELADDDNVWNVQQDVLSVEAPFLIIWKAVSHMHGVHYDWNAKADAEREAAIELSKLLKKNAVYWQTKGRRPRSMP